MKKHYFYIIIFFIGSIVSPATGFASQTKDQNNKVILISFDGMRNDLTKKYVKDGNLPHIESLMKNGVAAKDSKTVTPSLTAPSHAAIATGAAPSETGMVSNKWQDPHKELANGESAFHQPLDKSPLWKEAKKNGKTTATVLFPGSNPNAGSQADYAVYYGETWAESSLDKLNFIITDGGKHTEKSFSPIKEAKMKLSLQKAKNREINILAMDTTDDGKTNYDRFILSHNRSASQDDSAVKANEWGSFPVKVDRKSAGFWFKLKADPALEKASIYRTAVTSALIKGPAGFKEEISSEYGFFPVQDDTKAFRKGWISREEYEEISSRFASWTTDVSLHIKEKYQPDLLMFYAPQIDHESHHFLLTDPRQPEYTEERSKKHMKYIEWSYKLADDVVGRTMDSLNKNDHLLIVSDHGMEPVHTILAPNTLLKEAGHLKTDKEGKVDAEKSKAIAVASGSAAQIYINKDLSEPEKEKVTREVENLFSTYQIKPEFKKAALKQYFVEMGDTLLQKRFSDFDQKTRQFFNYLLRKKEHPYQVADGSEQEKDHPNEGEILLLGAKGFMMGSGLTKAELPVIELGSHGSDPDRKELKAVFIAQGPSFKKDEKTGSITTLDIAPTVYKILGIPRPDFLEGEVPEDTLK
ncbi:alkaline phosphatase family protein [Bacillus sp. ISL-47]|uniref:alkaline phosphatase family protein n=1 Tax=Bacillus sp. ISL-47 TaxID=2819130 RepID=UPI001BEAC8B0|nr:nucleotide pyrophosphatase/phosphodiesterase family protein [Bacillus sp. ISL-47]MBT2688880.1 alkaline phosphatase family protein [Bacillus sp. ISL-47]MBT2709095.1 alkaline phosphatase family protein [Pseudomonas sp. ISL-84]